MKLHAKPLSSLVNQRGIAAGGAGSTGKERSSAPVGVAGMGGQMANLQALAAELHQSSTQGVFSYPRKWTQIARAAAVTLLLFSLLHLVLVARPLLFSALPWFARDDTSVSAWQVGTSVFGVLLAVFLAALLTNLFPAVRITPNGIGISELVGWRYIPWSQVGMLRVMELEKKGRYIVMLPFRHATRPPTPAPVLKFIPYMLGASRGRERGLVISSDIGDFDRLLKLTISYMAQAAGQSMPRIELFIDETAVMPLAQLVLDREAAVDRLARRPAAGDMYGLDTDDAEPEVLWRRVLLKQALVALPAALLVLVSAAQRETNGWPSFMGVLWSVVVLALGVAELPFAAKLSQTVGDMMVGSGQMNRPALAYLELQMPRMAILVLGLGLVCIGAPAQVALVFWFAAALLTTWLLMRFLQRLYYLPATGTLLAVVGIFIYQTALVALYFGLS